MSSHYDDASVLSRLTFWWLRPMVSLAHKRGLQLEDIPPISKEVSSEALSTTLAKEWEEARKKGPSHLYLAYALFMTLRWHFFRSFFPPALQCITVLATPILVEKIIKFVDCEYIFSLASFFNIVFRWGEGHSEVKEVKGCKHHTAA